MSSSTIAGFKKRRSWLRICEEILTLCVDGCRTTKIVYGTNLAFPRFQQYTDFLIEKDLLVAEEDSAGKEYKTTERGHRYLKLMNEITDLLEEEVEALIEST
jgi:predicted transcriptional regulator